MNSDYRANGGYKSANHLSDEEDDEDDEYDDDQYDRSNNSIKKNCKLYCDDSGNQKRLCTPQCSKWKCSNCKTTNNNGKRSHKNKKCLDNDENNMPSEYSKFGCKLRSYYNTCITNAEKGLCSNWTTESTVTNSNSCSLECKSCEKNPNKDCINKLKKCCKKLPDDQPGGFGCQGKEYSDENVEPLNDPYCIDNQCMICPYTGSN